MCSKRIDVVNGVCRKDRLEKLWRAMESALGKELPVKDRHMDMFAARAFVFLQMKKEGFSSNGTADLVGKNHATVLNATRAAQYYIKHPAMYPDYNEIYKKFIEQL